MDSLSNYRTRRNLRGAIARQRAQVLDLDIVVTDHRAAIDREVEALREAVRARDRAAVHLGHLLSWYDELAVCGALVAPETVTRHALRPNEASAS